MSTVRLKSGKLERTTIEKFMKWVYPEPNTGCWLWGGKDTKTGYGNTKKVTIDGHTLRGSHRVSYYLFNGQFDYKMFICHKCDNPGCVNPDHLFAGTTQQNTADMKSKGRASRGSHRPTAKLTESQVLEIRKKYATGLYSQRALGKQYGIDWGNIGGIIRRETWSHI